MAEQNLYVNQLLSDPVYFADLCNGLLFDGRPIIAAGDLTPARDQSGIVYADRNGVKKVLERRRDVAMYLKGGPLLSVVALENQANVHYAMPVRSMLYDALDYTDQVQNLQRAHQEQEDSLDSSEFLSGIRREDRLIPVITLVLYWGNSEWDGCQNLHALLGLGCDDPISRRLADFIPDYRINLIQMSKFEDPARFRTHLQQIFSMLKCNRDKQALYQYVQEHREDLDHMDGAAKMALLSVIGEQKRLQKLLEKAEQKEEWSMSQAIDELIADGEKRGLELGEKRGLELGEKRGLELGEKRGLELGEKRGLELGEKRLSSLLRRLMSEDRLDLVRQVLDDPAVRRQLYKRYNL